MLLSSLSPATTRTFRVLPPTVQISAFTVFSRKDFRISISSGIRSDRSSQHNDALNISLPSPPPPEITVISSVSDGTVSSSVISDVCCFNSFTRSTTFARSEALSVWNQPNTNKIIFFTNSYRTIFFTVIKDMVYFIIFIFTLTLKKCYTFHGNLITKVSKI